MTDAGELLLLAVARSLADGGRVMLVGDSFETLQLLAEAEVKELVVLSEGADPEAPPGETATGAPFRVRPDWRERPNSKDLVVDPGGVAPLDEVARVLKKHGIYLSRGGPTHAGLPHHAVLAAGVAEALVLGSGAHRPVVLGAPAPDGPAVHLAGLSPITTPDVVALLSPEATGTRTAQLDAALADARAAVTEQAEALRAATTRAHAADAALAELAVERARAAADASALSRALADLAQLEAEFDAVRAELAERRVADRRLEAVTTRFDTARTEMGAEVDRLRHELQAVGATAEDEAELVVARDAARDAAGRVVAALDGLVRRQMADWEAEIPPSGASEAVLGAWLDAVQAAVERVDEARAVQGAALSEAQRRLEFTERRARELAEALGVLEGDRAAPPAPSPLPAPLADADERVRRLEATLAAERALRADERAEIEALGAAAERALGAHAEVAFALRTARREAATARLGRAAAEDASARLEAETALRDARVADLEAMLHDQNRMQGLLAEALEAAESAREQADHQRRLADENLRLLRTEFERPRPPAP